MAKKETEQVKLQKGKAQFEVVGEVGKIGDYSFKINETSETGFEYSSLRLNIKVSTSNTIGVEAIGGYFPSKVDNVIKVRNKEDNVRFDLAWEDRFTEVITDNVSDYDFITVGLEKDTKGNTFYKKFLSWYDAVDYVKANIKEGEVVKVKGNLTFGEYNGNVQIRKQVTSIFLTNAKPEEYSAKFIQTILLDDKSVDKSHAKTDKIVDINARVVDYDRSIKASKTFNLLMLQQLVDGKEKACLKVLGDYLTAPKGKIREIAVEGNIEKSSEVGKVSVDDIPTDLKELIDAGIYTEEEVLGKMAVKGNKTTKLFVVRPYIQKNKDNTVQLFIEDDKYKEQDLFVAPSNNSSKDEKKSEPKADTKEAENTESKGEDLSWMNELD